MAAIAPARETLDDGVRAISRELDSLTVSELRFPPDYRQPVVQPEAPYLAVCLSGGMMKSFPRSLAVKATNAVTIPAGATHSARFGRRGARVLVLQPGSRGCELTNVALIDRAEPARLAWQLLRELHATDDAAPLAIEGLSLELLAAAERGANGASRGRVRPRWLTDVEELLRSRPLRPVGLGEAAAVAGIHPAQVARVFRRWHGMSVGEYARAARLDVAATRLVDSDVCIARVAAETGFADQSHLTRAFRRHTGFTPGRYRELFHAPSL